MNKKILILVLMAILLCASLILSSCEIDIPIPDVSFGDDEEDDTGKVDDDEEDEKKPDPKPDPHEHEFSDEWKTDEFDHWNECECGQATNIEPHADTNTDYLCDKCGFRFPEPEPELYRVKYYIHLSNGDYKKLFEQKVNSKTGFTAEQIAEKDSIMHDEGYLIDYYFVDKDGSEHFDFSVPPTADCEVYCEREMTKAGPDVYWTCAQNKIGGYTLKFTGTGDMYEYYYDSTVPWYTHKDLINEVIIPEGITSIADCAFYQFSRLETVELPSTLRHIGRSAFYQSSISYMIFPDSLRTIGEAAFQDCLGLVHNTFNNGLQEIGKAAFYQCKNLETMVFPISLETIGGSAFYACTSISSVYYLGTEDEYNLIKSYLDNFWAQELAVTYFLSQTEPEAPGPYWYHGEKNEICQWYNTIWYMASPSAKVPFVRDYVNVETGYNQANVDFLNDIVYHGYRFDYFRLSTDNKEYEMVVGNKLTEDIRLVGVRGKLCGDNLQWAYRNNVLTISKIDKSLDDGAMWDFETIVDAPWYSNRERIYHVILDGVTYVGSYAFCDMRTGNAADKYEDFSYIDIPECVKKINVNAFSGCFNLLYIYYAGSDISAVEGLDSLLGVQDAKVYACATNLDLSAIKGGRYWTTVTKNLIPYRVAWIYDEQTKTLTVGGGDTTHFLPDFDSAASTPWASYSSEVERVVINENMLRVGHYAFYGMSSVSSIQAPRRLRIIKNTAFVGTAFYETKLATEGAVYIPTSEGQAHLVRINPDMVGEIYIIPEMTLSVAESAFDGCSAITDLVFSKDIGVDAIHSGAFAGLTSIQRVFYWGDEASWVEYDNYSTVSLQELKAATVYFYTASDPYAGAEDGEALFFWYWNDPAVKDYPLVWQAPAASGENTDTDSGSTSGTEGSTEDIPE